MEVQNISSAVKDDININMIKHFFDEDGWKAVLHAYKERRKLAYLCKNVIKMRMNQELMQFSVTHVVNGCIIPAQASLENQGVRSGFAKIVNKVA